MKVPRGKALRQRPARRRFLRQCWQATGALLLPPALESNTSAQSINLKTAAHNPEFHFQPHYREQASLDDALLQIKGGHDEFVTEPYHDKIAAILETWRETLLQSPDVSAALKEHLHAKFQGTSPQPVHSQALRPPTPELTVHRLSFASETSLPPERFRSEMQSAFGSLERVLTAEFQITEVAVNGSAVAIQVHYEIVGKGRDLFREQRAGSWSIDWEIATESSYRAVRWQAHDEVRARASQAFYADVTERALGTNPSYRSQMLHGADYWRTVLDGACGIDIYGHNGVSVGDIDGDGFDDIYICQPAGLPNRLYRNRGDGTFEDVTEHSDVGLLENTACALIADFDNDGHQDLVVVTASGPLYFHNTGEGKFLHKPGAFQFANPPQGTFTGAATADYNRDGRLDIYFCLYVYYQGADQYKYPSPYFAAENGPPNFLMHNNGDGTFSDVTAQSGLNKNNSRYSFCCGWADYNRDGWPDLYVVNDFGLKNLYRNNGDGTFTDVAHESGVEDAGAGMSVCWLDYNNDGFEDLYVANMWTAAGERITSDKAFQKEAPPQAQTLYRKHAMGNSLFRNPKDSGFRDVTESSRAGVGRWSWSSDSWDFDHDGFSDIYVTNGMISGTSREDLNSFFWRQVVAKSPNTAKPDENYEAGWKAINELIRSGYSWSGFERNILYANNRDGTFSDISGAIGLDFLEDGRSFAVADFDGDGRQEFLLKNRNAPQLRLLKNTIPALPPSIAFRLRGTRSNRDAIGATVTIHTSVGQQTKSVAAGSGFLSQHSKELFFGLGEATGDLSATVRWPNGVVQQIPTLPPNHRVFVIEGSDDHQLEAFRAHTGEITASAPSRGESLPDRSETWLLVPVSAPAFSLGDAGGKRWSLSALRGKPALLNFFGSTEELESLQTVHQAWARQGPQLLAISPQASQTAQYSFPVLRGTDDVLATYNLLFQYLFDRHQDLPAPSSFLIDEAGQVVKVYRGQVDLRVAGSDCKNIPRTPAERLAKALPFPGVSSTFEFGRNYLSLGSIFFQRGYVEGAGDFFRSALKTEPESAEACYGIGSVYLKQDKSSEAREWFDRTTKAKAAYPETEPNAWNNLGLLAAREGDMATAVECFQQALERDPDHFITLKNLGNAYRQQKRWEEARKALEHALSIKPFDPEGNYSLGMVFAQLNETDQAYQHLQKALQSRPAYPEALNNLGVLYLRTQRRNEAIASFEQCIRVAPAFDQAYLNLARVYAIEGDREKARRVLRDLLAQHPDHPVATQALAQLS